MRYAGKLKKEFTAHIGGTEVRYSFRKLSGFPALGQLFIDMDIVADGSEWHYVWDGRNATASKEGLPCSSTTCPIPGVTLEEMSIDFALRYLVEIGVPPSVVGKWTDLKDGWTIDTSGSLIQL